MPRVLVTGACGFLGSHVCEFYAKRDFEVISYDNMTKYELARTGFATEEARDFNRVFLEGLGVKTVKADIRDFEELLDHSQRCEGTGVCY